MKSGTPAFPKRIALLFTTMAAASIVLLGFGSARLEGGYRLAVYALVLLMIVIMAMIFYRNYRGLDERFRSQSDRHNPKPPSVQ